MDYMDLLLKSPDVTLATLTESAQTDSVAMGLNAAP
jgi:hypothetical protein